MQDEEGVDKIIAELQGGVDTNLQGGVDANLQGDDLNAVEDKLHTFLRAHHAKVLRRVCTKLSLKATSCRTNWDNKAGYVSLLLEYYRARGEAVGDASEGARVITTAATESRATKHCSFRLLNVMFSDDFGNRLGEAGGTPSRQELDIGAVNGNSQYWVDITEAYNNDREHYNGFALGKPRSQYVSVDPALAVSHARSKLIGLWERVVRRYDSALTKAKRVVFNAAFWEYCDGHVDALYMDDWLQIREDHQGNIVGLLPQNSHTSTLSNDKEVPTARPPVDASDEAPTKRRRLGAVDRILEYIQEDEETGIAERQRVREERYRRQREREESRKGESCAVLDRLSVSVRGAMATLQVLKEGRANQEQIDAAERALNKLISSWTQAMTNAANEQQ